MKPKDTVLIICAPVYHILLSSRGVVTACFMTTKCDVTAARIANCSLVLVVYSQKRAICSKSAIIKPISGCVRIACSGLMITSLLQVVNRLAAGCEQHAGLMQVVS